MPPDPAADRDPSGPVGAETVAVAENFVRLVRIFARHRARVLAARAHDVEWSAQLVLKCLHNAGTLRSSEVAEHLHADPSTISRQVAGLVKDGLLERRADPEDGRASLLALTGRADAVLARHDEIRNRHFATMLADWSERDLRRFADLLARFTADFEAVAEKQLSEPDDSELRSAEGNP